MSEQMARCSWFLVGLPCLLFGCETDDPQGLQDVGGAVGAGGGDAKPQALVFVQVNSTVAPVSGLDILVHDSSGALLRRGVSTSPALAIAAHPGDTVGLVRRDSESSDPEDGWLIESVRVTQETHAISFVVDPESPVEPPNAPIDLQIEAERASAVTELFVGASCVGDMLTTGSATFLNYAGCPDGSASFVFAFGLDADGGLLTFASASVNHGDQTQAIDLPATPVPMFNGHIELSWTDLDVLGVQGGTVLGGSIFSFMDPDTWELMAEASPASPIVYDPRIASSMGARVHIQAEVNDASGCGGLATIDRFLGLESEQWQLDRLAFASIAVDPYQWSLPAGGRGDAVVIDLDFHHGSYRWVEPPINGEHAVAFPELPDDLAGHFDPNRDDLDSFYVTNDERDGTADYLEYVAAGTSNRGFSKDTGQAAQVGPCIGATD